MIAEQTHSAAQTMLIATFHVHGTMCGVDAMKVQEVIRVNKVTQVHHAPEQIVGIINLRGKIVTVIDLGIALGLGRLTMKSESRAFIIEWHGEQVGLLADSASDVVAANPEAITPPPANMRGTQSRYFEGVYQATNGLIAILNIATVLGQQDDAR
jgi:purine-binding chemotaxis protein CheW